MLPIEPTSQAGKKIFEALRSDYLKPTSQAGNKIFEALRSDYLKRVRNLSADLNDRDYEIDFDQSTIDFLDDMNELSEYYKKAHRALTVLEQAGVI